MMILIIENLNWLVMKMALLREKIKIGRNIETSHFKECRILQSGTKNRSSFTYAYTLIVETFLVHISYGGHASVQNLSIWIQDPVMNACSKILKIEIGGGET